MTFFDAILISIVEGLTEFLPISSTGHMILASTALGMENTEFLKTFQVSIQLGAILAIVFLYARRFLKSLEIYKKLIVAFLPAAVVGFMAHDFIKAYLFNPLVVSISLIIGGIILILIDHRIVNQQTQFEEPEKMPLKNAFWIGVIQCIAMIPGVSRAGATIVGGVLNGLNKKQAMEFSFLLAVPTMFAATGYDLLKTELAFSTQELMLLGVGLIGAFIFAWLAVKIFLSFVEKYGFTAFGWYRIVLGGIFLVLIGLKII